MSSDSNFSVVDKLKSFSERPTIQTISFLLLFAFIFKYYYYIQSTSANCLTHLDDSKFFLSQYIELWLNQDSILGKFKYFFEEGNWPHPKINGRIFTLLSIFIFGELNFNFISFLGSLCVVINMYALYKISNVNYLLFLPIVISGTVFYNFSAWLVALIGYGFLISNFLLGFYFLQKEKHFWANLFFFLTTFSSGVGIFTYPLVIFYYLVRKKWMDKNLIIYILTFIISILLFYNITLDADIVKSNIESGATDYLRVIKDFISFFGFFTPDKFSFLIGLLGLLLFFVLSYMNRTNKRAFILFNCGLFFLGIALISAYINQKRGQHSFPERYFMFPQYLWILIYLQAVMLNVKDLIKLSLGIVLGTFVITIPLYEGKHPYFLNKHQITGKKKHKIRKFRKVFTTDYNIVYDDIKHKGILQKTKKNERQEKIFHNAHRLGIFTLNEDLLDMSGSKSPVKRKKTRKRQTDPN